MRIPATSTDVNWVRLYGGGSLGAVIAGLLGRAYVKASEDFRKDSVAGVDE